MSFIAKFCAVFVFVGTYAHADDWSECQAVVASGLAGELRTEALLKAVRGGQLDPWVMAEVLINRGAKDHAKLFAAALPALPKRSRLARYVASRNWTAEDKSAQQRFRRAHRLRMRDEPLTALKVIAGMKPADSVLNVLALIEQAATLRDLDKRDEGDSGALEASRLAMKIGWIDGASSTLKWVVYNQFWGGESRLQERDITRIRQELAPREATLIYADILRELVCVAVTRSSVFFLPVGSVKGITEDCLRMSPPRPHRVAPDLKDIRGVVSPLDYLGTIDSVNVISTDDVATRIPFCALTDVRSVSYRTFTSLYRVRDERKPRTGKGVLGVGGDTDPPSFDELVPADAPSGSLTRAAERHRWSIVHIACPFDRDRGRFVRPHWDPLEVPRRADPVVAGIFMLRHRVQADLLVLSGSHTGLGLRPGESALYRRSRDVMRSAIDALVVSEAQGNKAGLPMRALATGRGYRMLLAHLWHRDQAASRKLLGHFQDLWKKAAKPLDVTAASALLRKAQRHVASKPEWKDPYYWAGWQLWATGE